MTATLPQRVLVAGMGNVLTGDDGFGVRVVEALQDGSALQSGVRVIEVGIGGIHLVQELMTGYDALVVVDAVDRGGDPGTVYTLVPEVRDVSEMGEFERGEFLADMHYTVPAKALMLARALGVLPGSVYIVGCQPESLDLGIGLSGSVAAAVAVAVRRIRTLLAGLRDGTVAAGDGNSETRTKEDVCRISAVG
ncbi:MAG: hydrogenase maturation protease [Longimicrobiaceae bacterium]